MKTVAFNPFVTVHAASCNQELPGTFLVSSAISCQRIQLLVSNQADAACGAMLP